MKIRTDFVTNSSSTSFIIARKPTEKQREVMLKFVQDELLGENTILLTANSPKEEVAELLEQNGHPEKFEKVCQLLKDGYQVSIGWVSLAPSMETAPFFNIWQRLEEADGENFVPVECTLFG